MPKNTFKIEPSKEDHVDNKLELVKYATEVQCRIREDINSDFVIAKFPTEKDKEALTEMTNNAYLSKRLITNLTKGKIHKWNKQRGKWEEKELTDDEKTEINNIANEIFDIHMIRHQMKAILERNKKDNPILQGIMGLPQEPEEETDEEMRTIKEIMKEKLKKKDKKEEENTQGD